jgi:hypothetical protein
MHGPRDWPPSAQSQIWHADPATSHRRDSLIVHDLTNATPSDADADALTAANESLHLAGCAVQRVKTGFCIPIVIGRWRRTRVGGTRAADAGRCAGR